MKSISLWLNIRGILSQVNFDQYKRNIPYSAIIQAFQGLIKQLVTKPQKRLDEWKSRISEALEPNAQVIVDVIP